MNIYFGEEINCWSVIKNNISVRFNLFGKLTFLTAQCMLSASDSKNQLRTTINSCFLFDLGPYIA